jgi:hypothetical protein
VRFCVNAQHDVCNWLIAAESSDALCIACRHNRTIPDLGAAQHVARWRQLELAKHRLFYALLKLRLPLATKAEDAERGLAFDFLADPPAPGGQAVVIGHAEGVITLSLDEADDAVRERTRLTMGEPYRTLLGHFRHETGHYYWERLVREGGRLDEFRSLFGDERQDYRAALQHHYRNGPSADWQQHFVAAYAGAHPWEDFAETWAHYLHIVDTLEMAYAFGLKVGPKIDTAAELHAAPDVEPYFASSIERLVEAWLPLTFAVNSLNRCMGQPDLYPFILSPEAIGKLGFIHGLAHPALSAARVEPAGRGNGR